MAVNREAGGSVLRSEMMATRNEISENLPVQIDDRLYVAVGKELKQSKCTLLWALHNSGGRRICILHVHEPAQWIPMMGAKFHVSQLGEHQVKEYRENERQTMNKLLQEYILICHKSGMQADTMYTEMNSIEKGIVELITQNGIRKLVMGAAADKHYSKKMMELKSKKATYVHQQAPFTCHVWFICKGHLVHTREGKLDGVGIEIASPNLQASLNSGTAPNSFLRSQSVIEERNERLQLTNSGPVYGRARTEIPRVENLNLSPSSSGGASTSVNSSPDWISSEWNEIFGRSPSIDSVYLIGSSSDLVNGSSMVSNGGAVCGLGSHDLRQLMGDHHQHLSPPDVLEVGMNGELYAQLEQAMEEADNSKREAFEESSRRRKAEKDVFDAILRGKSTENLYYEELRRRKETEETMARGNEEIEKMKLQLDEIIKELGEAQELEASLERQIENSEGMVQDLEQKMFSAVELLQKYKKERDELEVERDDALKVAEELRRIQVDKASSSSRPLFSEFSSSEIEEATNHFDQSLMVNEQGYESVYRAVLCHTQVAIKIRHSQSLPSPADFEQEVTMLSKLRHPNIVTLIGACQETRAFIYEYLPNGSLEDRLNCRDNTPPLSWQTRIRIAAELCSVLIFLHSGNPHSIAHGNLNPSSILLDANYVCKLSNFGIFIENTTFCCVTDHTQDTLGYMDPESVATKKLTPNSDVYSFGIILLKLLTGASALGIAKEVKCAFDNGTLQDLLDPTAGDWPFVQAKQLADLGLRCCEMDTMNRPDLSSEVLRVLNTMKFSCGDSSTRLSSEDHSQVPRYFVCPIFQEIMEDPHVAADGFTYELEALKGWLDSGHDTSPMTNLKLPHDNLVPNRALRSAIQEWRHNQ